MLKCTTISLLKLFRELTESADSGKLQQGTRQLAAVSPSPNTLGISQVCLVCGKKTYGGLALFTSDRICRHTCSPLVLFVLNILVQTPCMEGLS